MTKEYILHTAALGVALKRVAELSGNYARLNLGSVRDEASNFSRTPTSRPKGTWIT